MIICPNCHRDLTEHEEAVAMSGHEMKLCPACHFPIALYNVAKRQLGSFGFDISKSQTWRM